MKNKIKIFAFISSIVFFTSCTSSEAAIYAVSGAVAIADMITNRSIESGASSGGSAYAESNNGKAITGRNTQYTENYELGSFNMRSRDFTDGEHTFTFYVPETDYYRATKFIFDTSYGKYSNWYTSASIKAYFSIKKDHNLKVDIYGNVYDTDKIIADTFHITGKLDPYSNAENIEGRYFKYSDGKRVIPNQELLIVISNKGELVWTNNPPLYNKKFGMKKKAVNVSENRNETSSTTNTKKENPSITNIKKESPKPKIVKTKEKASSPKVKTEYKEKETRKKQTRQ